MFFTAQPNGFVFSDCLLKILLQNFLDYFLNSHQVYAHLINSLDNFRSDGCVC